VLDEDTPGEVALGAPAAVLDEDRPGEATLGAPAAPATLTPLCAIPAVERLAELVATVWRVVPAGGTGAAAIAPLGNDPAPQRH